MRLPLMVVLALLFTVGCDDKGRPWWVDYHPPPTASSPTNPRGDGLRSRLEHHVPIWSVRLAVDHGKPRVAATPQEGGGGTILLTDEASADRALKIGDMSLLDALAIADQIRTEHYRLRDADDNSGEGGGHGFGHGRALPLQEDEEQVEMSEEDASTEEVGEAAQELGRRFGGEGPDDETARQVYTVLLNAVRAHTDPGHASTTCSGAYALCSAGRRSFGQGIPCTIGGAGPTEFMQKYGRLWCPQNLLPALRQIVEDWSRDR